MPYFRQKWFSTKSMPQLWQKYPTSFHGSNANSRQKYSNDFLRNSRPILAEVSWFSAEVLTIFGWSTRWLTPELRAISGSMTRVISYRIHAPLRHPLLRQTYRWLFLWTLYPFVTEVSSEFPRKMCPILGRSDPVIVYKIHALLWQKYAMIFYGSMIHFRIKYPVILHRSYTPLVAAWPE